MQTVRRDSSAISELEFYFSGSALLRKGLPVCKSTRYAGSGGGSKGLGEANNDGARSRF